MSEKDEETFRKIVTEIRFLETTAEVLQSRINLLNAALAELNLAKMTLEGLEKEKINTSTLIPIGGGSYVKAKLESTDTVVAGIGAGVAIEKSVKDARETISKRIEEYQKHMEGLQQRLTQVSNRIYEDRAALEELSQKLARRSTTDVRKTKGRT